MAQLAIGANRSGISGRRSAARSCGECGAIPAAAPGPDRRTAVATTRQPQNSLGLAPGDDIARGVRQRPRAPSIRIRRSRPQGLHPLATAQPPWLIQAPGHEVEEAGRRRRARHARPPKQRPCRSDERPFAASQACRARHQDSCQRQQHRLPAAGQANAPCRFTVRRCRTPLNPAHLTRRLMLRSTRHGVDPSGVTPRHCV